MKRGVHFIFLCAILRTKQKSAVKGCHVKKKNRCLAIWSGLIGCVDSVVTLAVNSTLPARSKLKI